MELLIDTLESEIGAITLVCGEGALRTLDFERDELSILDGLESRFGQVVVRRTDNPLGYTERLRAYLDRDFGALDDIRVEPAGTTFQQHVWRELRKVRPGSTVSYGEIAGVIGRPSASRAVGMANARNPIAIVIPCHRVIGADGSLTGYAGGLVRKRWLLEHEGVRIEWGMPLFESAGIAMAC
jgi:methylated-DNA-[protein]-cysteine S-methyltransferase